MTEWVIRVPSESFSRIVVLHLFRESVVGEDFTNAPGSESDSVVVALNSSALFVRVVLNELTIPLTVILKEMCKRSNRTVTSVNRAGYTLVKTNVPRSVLHV
jgi:hypothetical protein